MLQIKVDIIKYSNRHRLKPKDHLLQAACDKARQAFCLNRKVKMIHLNDLFQHKLLTEDIWKKSPGLPWKMPNCQIWSKPNAYKPNGFRTTDEIRRDPRAIHWLRRYWHYVKEGKQNEEAPHCLAFSRHYSKEISWEYSATMTCGEALFALPLTRAYQNIDGPIAYGYETPHIGRQKIYKRFSSGYYYAGFEFIEFHKTVPAWLIFEAFKVLRTNIDFNYFHEGANPTNESKMTLMWNHMVDYFINATIRTADGWIYRKSSGVLPCSYFAQLIISVCNYILCTWISLHQFRTPKDILVMEDQSLLSLSAALDLQSANKLMSTIGMKLSEKSQVTQNLNMMMFLGYEL